MKKLLQVTAFVLLFALCLSLSACVVNEPTNETTPESESTPSEPTPSESTPSESTPVESSLDTPTSPESSNPAEPESSPSDQLKARSYLYKIINAHRERLSPEQLASTESVTLCYYGLYENNGVRTYVMFIFDPGIGADDGVWQETVGSQTFTYYNSIRLEAFVRDPYNDRLCTLGEAYEVGAINDKQLAALNERVKAGNETQIREEELILENEKEKVIKAYAEKESVRPETVSLRYLGCYNDAFVAFADVRNRPLLDAVREVQIGDHTVVYRDSQVMTVYYEGEFYSLEKAYEDGIISDQAIAEIIEKHSGQLYLVATLN